jgi:hypothetical protein
MASLSGTHGVALMVAKPTSSGSQRANGGGSGNEGELTSRPDLAGAETLRVWACEAMRARDAAADHCYWIAHPLLCT